MAQEICLRDHLCMHTFKAIVLKGVLSSQTTHHLRLLKLLVQDLAPQRPRTDFWPPGATRAKGPEIRSVLFAPALVQMIDDLIARLAIRGHFYLAALAQFRRIHYRPIFYL